MSDIQNTNTIINLPHTGHVIAAGHVFRLDIERGMFCASEYLNGVELHHTYRTTRADANDVLQAWAAAL